MGYDGPEADSDLEIEVGPLRRSSGARPSGETETRPLFAPAPTRRKRLRRGILVTGALTVTLVALLVSIAPTREALRGVVFGPTPTATEPVRAGEDHLYITISPDWGSVSLDDRPISHLPVEGIEQPLRLARGVHVLRWRFDPIINTACVLTVPSSDEDTCPERVGLAPYEKGIARVVPFRLSLATVEPTYYESLRAAIQAALDSQNSSDIVRQGELYLGRYDTTAHRIVPVAATQPLRATLRFISDADNMDAHCPAITSGVGAYCMMNGDCRELCTAPWQTPPDIVNSMWQAYIVAYASWEFTTLDGRVLIQNQPDVGGVSGVFGDNEIPVPIAIGWDGSRWHVSSMIGARNPSSPLPDLVCASALADVQNSFVAPPDPGGWQAVTLAYIPGSQLASGCLLVMKVAGKPPLLVLHRFGVALAANAATADTLCCPTLPVADAFEQQLAQRMLASQQGG